MADKPTTIDEYIAGVPDDKRAALQALRHTIREAAPEAEEVISYGTAAFRQKKMLVSFGAAANHCAFYVMSPAVMDTFKGELASYDTSTGTIRFKPDKPLPPDLVKRLVQARLQEIGS